MHGCKLTLVSITALVLSTAAHAQSINPEVHESSARAEVFSVVGCVPPDEAKEAKVIDIDASGSQVRFAVKLAPGRFKVASITVWDRTEDPRPLIPVIDAARIMQGVVQFYTPNLNSDPESAHQSFLVVVEMGGRELCWATPSSLLRENEERASDGKPSTTRNGTDPVVTLPGPDPETTPTIANSAPSQSAGKLGAALPPRKSRTPPRVRSR
jgi:hypothetical protein